MLEQIIDLFLMGKRNRYCKGKWRLYNHSIKQNEKNEKSKEIPFVNADTPNSITNNGEVKIYKSELDYILRCIHDYPHIETGGQLFGLWHTDGTPVVLYAIGPGRNANHQPTFFNQDIKYLETIGHFLYQKMGLCHIGEWHSHHQLGLARPSGYDSANIANNIVKHNIPRFILCIGNCTNTTATINAFRFNKGDREGAKTQWNVMDAESPYRSIIDETLKDIICHPHTQTAVYGQDMMLKSPIAQNVVKKVEYSSEYWMERKESNADLKKIWDYLRETHYEKTVSPMLDSNRHIHIMVNGVRGNERDIYFPQGFPIQPPIIMERGNAIHLGEGQWRYEDNIFSSFRDYYERTIRYDG